MIAELEQELALKAIGVIGAIAAAPQIVLVALAYSYLISGLVGHVINRGRTVRNHPPLNEESEVKRSVS